MNVACTQCGTPAVRGNRFCGRCGSPLPPSTGNLPIPTTAAPQPATPPPGPPTALAASTTACWQCGGPVDLLHQVTCANCGARLIAGPPAAGPPVGPRAAPPPASLIDGPPLPTPLAVDGGATAAPVAKEPLLSGAALTLIVAILIVLALAVAGIVAGQAI